MALMYSVETDYLTPPSLSDRHQFMFRLRISLKWFLLGTTLVGALVGTFGKQVFDDWYRRQWLRRQQEIAKELTAAGCQVKMTDGRVVEVNIPASEDANRMMAWVSEATELEKFEAYCPITDEDVALLGEHSKLRDLRIFGPAITNRSLGTIGRLLRLEDLAIYRSRVNDDGLDQIRGLAELRHLCLVGTPNFTGKGLGHLSELRKLRWIELWQVHMRDGEGLAKLDHVDALEIRQSQIEPGVLIHVTKMKNLKSLGFVQSTMADESLVGLKDARQLERIAFTGASVSDKGMVYLYDLKQLQQITVAMSKVTEEGARELRNHLPDTAITE